MGKLVNFLFLAGLVALAASEIPIEVDRNDISAVDFSVEEEFFRIPEDIDPIHFEVEVTPYFDTAPAGKSPFSFDGLVTIHMKVVKDDVSSIYIQENVREILGISLTTAGSPAVPVAVDVRSPYERIRSHHFLKINLAGNSTLQNGQDYILTIQYIGNINETPLQRGVFRGHYKDANGRVYWYAATHLQPVNSRQAFPSFDEPGFKSTFDIIINRPANFGETFSNMPLKESINMGDRVKEIFHRTPRMSAYLVTFHISEEFTVIADNNDPVRSYRILARPTAAGQGEYALEVGPPLTKWLDDYFEIGYYSMDANLKNDQIASPYWASGATENWGLVTYREVRLLYEAGETNALDKMYIGTITAHELAHKWFGNLITARWWDNVWINEGFASYFEYFAMDGVDKSMELEYQFNIMYVQSALSADSSAATRALQHTVNSPAQVTGHFSGISYSKGASLLLMTKHFVSEPIFKKALTDFLTVRSYENALPIHLYEAFSRAVEGTNIGPDIIYNYLQYWVDEPGSPIITVEVHPLYISVTQERFFINPSTPQTEQLWPIPLTFATASNPDFTNLDSSERYMDSKFYTILNALERPGEEWIIFNVQQKGLYRVNYDPNTWRLIANQLKDNLTVIHHLNRAQIVDDVFVLMRSTRISYELGFEILDFLREDTSYYSWYPAITGFSWLRNRFLHLPEVLAEFDDIILEYLEAVIEDLGYDVVADEPLTRTLNRFFVLSFACNNVGHEGCIRDSLEKFNVLRTNGVSVNPNLRRHVFCQGLLAGGYEEWKFLYDRRQSSNNQADEVAMLRSLGCTTNDQARQEYLNAILDDDVVKPQDRVNAFSFLMMGHRSNANVVLQFLKQNYEAIRRGVVLQAWFESVISNVASYLDVAGLDDMEAWLRANQNSIPEFNLGINSVNSARSNQAWGTENAETVLKAASREEDVTEEPEEPEEPVDPVDPEEPVDPDEPAGPDGDSAVAHLPTAMLLLTTCIALMLR